MSHIYNGVKYGLTQGTFDWDDPALTYRLVLVGIASTYIPSDADVYMSDFTGGGGVEVATRVTLASRAIVRDDLSSLVGLDADDVAYPGLNVGRVKAGLIYRRVGADDTTPTDDPLVAYIDQGVFPFDTDSGNWTLKWSASGICVLV